MIGNGTVFTDVVARQVSQRLLALARKDGVDTSSAAAFRRWMEGRR